jgi:DNA invertase Pin-like site-specific DNA recombinase
MREFYGYARVSTMRQGEHGVSLQEQKSAIQRYADSNSLAVVRVFEERETAAKRGRPVFGRMMELLKTGKASGVVMHKIDRSARNLKDWADLGELIDSGVDIRFANESLDLTSRGGRLSADIQAVVAADYIRNLREETKKGIYGRLKQGLLPMPARTGYLSQGPGKVKLPDPVQAPMVRRAFELYATGAYNLKELAKHMESLGLRNRMGGRVTNQALERIFRDPIYIGIIRLKRSGETFPGIHEPIVSTAVFQEVQDTMSGKRHRKTGRHDFTFRQLFTCALCKRSLVGELHKGTVYYRCHGRGCPSATLPERTIEKRIIDTLKRLEFTQEERDYCRQRLNSMAQQWNKQRDRAAQGINLNLDQLKQRQSKLTDAFLDEAIDKETFEQRKSALLVERRQMEERLSELKNQDGSIERKLRGLLELASSAYSAYRTAQTAEKRELVKIISSNRSLNARTLTFTASAPFDLIQKRFEISNGCHVRVAVRDVWERLLPQLIECVCSGSPNQTTTVLSRWPPTT